MNPSLANVRERVTLNARGCWLWQGGTNHNGYGLMYLGSKRDGSNHQRRVHRVVYELAHGSCHGLCVLHHCDNRQCCNPDHLFLGTRADNYDDMRAKGRQSFPPVLFGESNRNSKLTAAQVAEIRSRAATDTFTTLANDYGVCRKSITNVVNGLTWAA